MKWRCYRCELCTVQLCIQVICVLLIGYFCVQLCIQVICVLLIGYFCVQLCIQVICVLLIGYFSVQICFQVMWVCLCVLVIHFSIYFFRLSKKGTTIIFSIHQPRYSIYKLFDNLFLLDEGKLLYQGQASEALSYFSSIGTWPS